MSKVVITYTVSVKEQDPNKVKTASNFSNKNFHCLGLE